MLSLSWDCCYFPGFCRRKTASYRIRFEQMALRKDKSTTKTGSETVTSGLESVLADAACLVVQR